MSKLNLPDEQRERDFHAVKLAHQQAEKDRAHAIRVEKDAFAVMQQAKYDLIVSVECATCDATVGRSCNDMNNIPRAGSPSTQHASRVQRSGVQSINATARAKGF